MLACRINGVLSSILAIPTLPIQFVTTFVGGCLVGCSFGLLLIPLSLIWIGLLGALLATSWLWDNLGALRFPPLVAATRAALAVVGIPLALIAQTYVALTPSMGDLDGRAHKLSMCYVWPFTLDYMALMTKSGDVETLSPKDRERYDRLIEAMKIVRSPISGRG